MTNIEFGYDVKLKGILLQRGTDKLFFPDHHRSQEVEDVLLELRHKARYTNSDAFLCYVAEDRFENAWNKLFHLAKPPPTPATIDDIHDELNFCCCGVPEDNARYIRDGLKLIGEKAPDVVGREHFESWFRKHRLRETNLHGNDRACWFFKYWADSCGFTEHGSGISAGWLTTNGEEFLAKLERAIENDG